MKNEAMYSVSYIWAKVLHYAEAYLSDIAIQTWFNDAEALELKDGKLIVYSPSEFHQETIRKKCAPYIEEALRELFHIDAELVVWGDGEFREYREQHRSTAPVKFNTQFSFASFISGASNRMAMRIAQATAQEPGQDIYNPLFIYGPSGVGKTHLLYAMANHILEHHPGLKVMYVSGEHFTNDLIQALRVGDMAEFKKRYRREADVFLVDDIHFIAGKNSTQDEFFHTFNELYAHKKQIVMTADRRPSDMSTLEDRLRTRFGQGILVGIDQPDSDTRLSIIRAKAKQLELELDEDTVAYLADRLQDSVRQIEGALKKLRVFKNLGEQDLSLPAVMRTVEDIITTQTQTAITAPMVLRQVCKYFAVDEDKLKGSQRSRNIAHPRQVLMYLLRTQVGMSLEDIGKLLHRDHGTVHHAVKKVEGELTRGDHSLKEAIEKITSNLEHP